MTLPRTMRLRLTLLYGGIFLVSSIVVLAAGYALVDRTLAEAPRRVQDEVGGPPGGVGGPPRGGSDVFDRAELVRDVQESIREDVLDRLFQRSVFVVGATALLAFGAGWIVAGRALRPVHAITATARSLSESNLHSRIAHVGPDDELKEMADTFDALLDRLERAFESQRRFVASASHELRSPLTIMRARAETPSAETPSSRVELRETVVVQVERADRLIEALLTLTRSQGTLLATDEIDLAGLVGDVLSPLSEQAARAGLELEVTIEDATVIGDAPLLERLVGNLVENAIHHNVATPAEHVGRITVEVGGGARAFVRVVNDGPLVPSDRIPELLEPFRRGAADRTGVGYGLGLAVVHSVARAHGATLDLAAREAGGLDVRVTFPPIPTPS